MNHIYKALITDLDGTAVALTSNGYDIDESTQDAVRHAIDAGKKLCCATGREWDLAKPVVKKLGFISPCIVEGGTRIIDPLTETTIWEKAMDDEASTHIIKIFKTTTSNGVIMHSANSSHLKLSNTTVLPNPLRYVYLLGIDEKDAIEISNTLNATNYAVAHLTPSWDGHGLVDIHVTHPEATKEHAIRIWQRLEKIHKEETIGMGDSGNDVPIFLSSGYKVAVSNATDNLRSLADYIAPSVSDHALEHVIKLKLLAD